MEVYLNKYFDQNINYREYKSKVVPFFYIYFLLRIHLSMELHKNEGVYVDSECSRNTKA